MLKHKGSLLTYTRGFTLLEFLLVVSIMAVIASLIAPLYLSYNERVSMVLASESIRGQVARAEAYARAGNLDSGWGVMVLPTSTTLYAGESFGHRKLWMDEVITFSSTYTISGNTNIVFERGTGSLTATSTIRLRSLQGFEKILSVHPYGIVEIE